MNQKIIILAGPTASGKSALALDMARKLNAVIINADSKQVYKEIPILTAQPGMPELDDIPHRLYGVVSVLHHYSVATWLEMVRLEIQEVIAQGQTPLLVGGSGMYIKALIDGIAAIPEISIETRNEVRRVCDAEGLCSVYQMLLEHDPHMAAKLKPNDMQRILRAYEVWLQTGKSLQYWHEQKITPLFPEEMIKLFFLMPGREETYARCNRRFVEMVENGVLDEVQVVDAMQVPQDMPAMRAHGLRELISHLHGDSTLDEAMSKAQQNTRNYVKRQFTWFRHQMHRAEILLP